METVAGVLAEAWVARGHEVRVVTQSAGNPDEDRARFRFPVHRRPGAGELWRLARWCDLFFQNNISLQTLWPLGLVRRPWVVVHQTWLTRVGGATGWQDRLKRALLRFGTSVAISRAVADRLPVAATRIGNPYAAETFGLRPEVPRTRPLVFLGRLVSDKGADVLIEALAILRDTAGLTPDLTIVGDGPELPALRSLADRLALTAQIEFVGQRTGEALVRTLNAHLVLVVPSRLPEPFGVVALEGAAGGCLVVGSEAGGLPDAIGPCGLLFPNGDARELARVLARALTDAALRAEVAAAAPAHLERHQPRQVAEAYLQVFDRARNASVRRSQRGPVVAR